MLDLGCAENNNEANCLQVCNYGGSFWKKNKENKEITLMK